MVKRNVIVFFLVLFASSFLSAQEITDPAVKKDEIPLRYIDLKLKFVYFNGVFDLYQKKHEINNLGFRLEAFRGIQVPDFSMLEIGLGASILYAGGTKSFTADLDPSEEGTYEASCEMNTSILATILMLKYCFTVDLNFFQIGLENGIGLAFCYQRNDWKFINPEDTSTDLDSDLERVEATKPVMDIALKLNLPLSGNRSFGISCGMLAIPTLIKLDHLGDYGPYKYESILEAGMDFKVYF